MRYTVKQIERVKRLRKEGVFVRRIMFLTHMGEGAIRYHTEPGRREMQIRTATKWAKDNPERYRRIQRDHYLSNIPKRRAAARKSERNRRAKRRVANRDKNIWSK